LVYHINVYHVIIKGKNKAENFLDVFRLVGLSRLVKILMRFGGISNEEQYEIYYQDGIITGNGNRIPSIGGIHSV